MTELDENLEAELAIEARRRIVVGVDGSSCSLAALRWAAREARQRDAELVALHAWQIPDIGLPGVSPPYSKEPFTEHARQLVQGAITETPDAAGAHIETVEGHPGHALVEASREASLLVVGCHGHGPIPGTLLGSAAHRAAMHATCPVVIVRSSISC